MQLHYGVHRIPLLASNLLHSQQRQFRPAVLGPVQISDVEEITENMLKTEISQIFMRFTGDFRSLRSLNLLEYFHIRA
jgi:hypothetical protein